jgi:hypothetical protein
MADNTEQRIRRLEAEIAELRAAKSAPQIPIAAPPLDEEGAVRVTYPRTYPIAMPTRAEYDKLLAIVARAGLVPRSADPAEFFAGFVASFERLASLRRLDGLDMGRQAHDWAIEAYGWLQQRGTHAETTNGSFFAACVAAGDVQYRFANSALGVPARVGLTHDTDARMAASSAWRGVLERGQPRPPLPLATTLESELHRPVSIVQIGYRPSWQ